MSAPTFAPWKNIDGTSVLREANVDAIAYVAQNVSIDADGAPNAYHPDNVGLDDNANAGYPAKSWWQSVLVEDPHKPGTPYVQPDTSAFPGFFVAKTSLHNPDPAISETNPAKYADATRIPYIVFTGAFYKEQGTGHLGDFTFVVSDAAYSWAILADTGGKHIGEISMFLASKLSGKPTNPRNGEGAPRAPLRFVVFQKTALHLTWPISDVQIQEIGATLSAPFGGEAALASLARSF
jgi:hypothetical protein